MRSIQGLVGATKKKGCYNAAVAIDINVNDLFDNDMLYATITATITIVLYQ